MGSLLVLLLLTIFLVLVGIFFFVFRLKRRNESELSPVAKVSRVENILTFLRGITHCRGKSWQYPHTPSSIQFDEQRGEYLNSQVFRGFPVGGIGCGGFSLATNGGFLDFKINNNWMRPIRYAKGSFLALSYSSMKNVDFTILLQKNI